MFITNMVFLPVHNPHIFSETAPLAPKMLSTLIPLDMVIRWSVMPIEMMGDTHY